MLMNSLHSSRIFALHMKAATKLFSNTASRNAQQFFNTSRCFRCERGQQMLNRAHTQTRRGFKSQKSVADSEAAQPPHGPPLSSLKRPFLFTLGVCGSTFLVAFIWNYEKWRNIIKKIDKGTFKHEDYTGRTMTEAEMEEVSHADISRRMQTMWERLTNGQKLILGIMTANLAVWGLWRLRSLQPVMLQYFASGAGRPLPSLTLASFSHMSPTHLAVNMYVLWSFGSVVANLYGVEQFSALYLSAGTIASFTSIAAKIIMKQPTVLSVGASGSIMALLGVVCMTYPNAKLSIVLLDQIVPHSFSASTGMKAVIAFDVLGLVLGWRVLDHAGHLGGILCGILYAKYGHKLIWGSAKGAVNQQWHNIRGK